MRFNITMFKEEFDENGFLKDKDKKVVEVQAATCCDAVVNATKASRGWTPIKWECLDKTKAEQEFIPETKYEKEAWAKVLKWREEEKLKKEQEAAEAASEDSILEQK